jgi:type II secretion system protein C
MRRFTVLRAIFGFFNAAVAVAILVFTYLYFITPAETKDLSGLHKWKMKPVPADPGAARRTAATYRSIWETPLPVHPVVRAEKTPDAPPPPPPRTPIEKLFTLTGTVATDNPKAGMAVLVEISSKKTLMRSADQTLPGASARIIAIFKDRIVVEDGKETEILFIKAETTPAASTAGPVAKGAAGLPSHLPSPTGNVPPSPGVAASIDPASFNTQRDAMNPNKWNVDRQEKQYLLRNLSTLGDQVNVRPVLSSDGKMTGVQVEKFAPNTFLRERGIETGDIIRKVNGIAITSQEQGNQLMNNPQIRYAPRYDLEVERNGQVYTYTYQVR